MSKFIKLVLIPLIVLIIAVAAVIFYLKYPLGSNTAGTAENTNKLTITEANVTYNVELAQTREEMEVGLMNRDSLPEDAGMLFNINQQNVAMYMKNTKIPLDMLFIDSEGMIFWIYENAEPESTTLIVSPYPAAAVLEVNGGDVKKHNIKIGNYVEHAWFKKHNHKSVSVSENDQQPSSEPQSDTQSEEAAQDNTAETGLD